MSKLAKYYVVASQGIITMVILSVGGFFLGLFIDKSNYTYAIVFCILGILAGLYILIKTLYNIGDDKNE